MLCGTSKKPGTFQGFSPTFQKLFLKRDLFDNLNGLRLVPEPVRFAQDKLREWDRDAKYWGGDCEAVQPDCSD